MPSDLDRLLDSIDPRRTLQEAERRAGEAINSFPEPRSQITRWEDFRGYLVQFLRHVEAHVLRLQGGHACAMATGFDWARCSQALIQAYGPNGEKAAFEMARTGNGGGLYAVLKKMAEHLSEQFAETEIAARVSRFWDGLSAHEQLAASDEYLGRYGHLLPSELTEGSAARLRANLPAVLREHPRMVARLRRVGRT